MATRGGKAAPNAGRQAAGAQPQQPQQQQQPQHAPPPQAQQAPVQPQTAPGPQAAPTPAQQLQQAIQMQLGPQSRAAAHTTPSAAGGLAVGKSQQQKSLGSDFIQNPEEFPPLGGGASASGPSTTLRAPSQPQGGASQPTGDRFGLTGLLSVIRMTDADLNALALGFDLTTLGLNLNSPDYLYTTFASPFADGPARVQPEYRIPSCYFMNPPHLRFQMFQRFQLETLFYIFYSMPCDVLQLAAAQELYNRDWRFHKELKMWFTRAPGTEPSVKTHAYEKGSYHVFDPEKWTKERKDDYLLVYEMLEEKTAVGDAGGQA